MDVIVVPCSSAGPTLDLLTNRHVIVLFHSFLRCQWIESQRYYPPPLVEAPRETRWKDFNNAVCIQHKCT